MNLSLFPSVPSGRVAAIPSKSDIHRKLICAALASEPTTVFPYIMSQDIKATIGCIKALGATVSEQNGIKIIPDKPQNNAVFDCRESGSTLRFILPVAASKTEHAFFTGSGRLPQRPLDELTQVMLTHGVSFSAPRLPFETKGRLTAGKYSLNGNVSSQYITGLLLSLVSLEGDSEIELLTPLQSAPYVDITLGCQRAFGINVEKTEGGFFISGGQRYKSPEICVAEGDWSNAAFFLCMGALYGEMTVTNLDMNSPQGDKQIVELLSRFGADVTTDENSVTVKKKNLVGCEIDVCDIPDLLPVLAVVAAFAENRTRFFGGERLKYKESDRLSAVANMLSALGADVKILSDGLEVVGKPTLSGGTVDSQNDHRIAMSAAVAAAGCENPVTLCDARAVDKSYPSFFEDYKLVGGKADVI